MDLLVDLLIAGPRRAAVKWAEKKMVARLIRDLWYIFRVSVVIFTVHMLRRGKQ